MFFNTIDFPNEIVDSIKEGKLVVFAGAGASVDSPTSLPDFEKLTLKIAEGTGYIRNKNVPFEVFLGGLKAKGINVNEEAAEILASSSLKHNKLHEAIVNLFPDKDNIKIVTTNYDLMFESVVDSKDYKVPVYSAPALPLGNDVHGIVHIHGDVNSSDYMVVTDDDFGKAYLTEGYTSKFLIKLFESYTVLFIGYSYKDTILRYLTRAMYRSSPCKKFILTTDSKSDWDSFDIIPIYYPKRKHALMREGLDKLGMCIKKNLFDWKKQLVEISEAPPEDLTVDAELDYCLENDEIIKILIGCVHGKAWVQFLDNRKVFDFCFSEQDDWGEMDNLWANWLCNNFAISESEVIFGLFQKHHNKINKTFAHILARRICDCESLDNNIFFKYVISIKNIITDLYVIERLVEEIYKRKQYLLGFEIYQKFFELNFNLQKDVWSKGDGFCYKHTFIGNYYLASRCWESIKTGVCEANYYDVLSFVLQKIEEVYADYSCINSEATSIEPIEMSMIDVEGREEGYRENLFRTLIKMCIDAADIMRKQEPNGLRFILMKYFNSKSILLRKLSLSVMRRTKVFPAKETIKLLIKHELLDDFYLKEQVYLLAADCFNNLSEKEKDSFIDVIEEKGEASEEKNRDIYESYNWCVWLQKVDSQNRRLNNYIDRIAKKYGFKPRKHPELSIDYSLEPLSIDKRIINENKLLDMKISDVVKCLSNYRRDNEEDESRYEFLKTFSNCVSHNFSWAKKVVEELLLNAIENHDVWQHLFYGIENSGYDIHESVELLEVLIERVNVKKYNNDLESFLLNILRKDNIKNVFVEHEELLLRSVDILWKNRSREVQETGNALNNALNSSCGKISLSLVYMFYYSNEKEIPFRYKERFENILNIRGSEKNTAVCILAGYFNLMCRRDKEWALEKIAPFLDGSSNKYYACAWDGYVFFSQRVYKEIADIIEAIVYKAIRKINLLSKDSKRGFMNILLTILVYFTDKPTHKFIPELYGASSNKDVIAFLRAIKIRLQSMEEAEIEKWWNDWLRLFLKNRKNNKPTMLTEEENQAIFELIPELEAVFDDAVNVICSKDIPKQVDSLFWFRIGDYHIAKKHPESAFKLITTVLKSVSAINSDEQSIKNIIKEMGKITKEQEVILEEVLLSKNIYMD